MPEYASVKLWKKTMKPLHVGAALKETSLVEFVDQAVRNELSQLTGGRSTEGKPNSPV